MAKESMKARQRKREAMVARYAEKRAKLKAEGNYDALQAIPRNASPVRLRNRCKLTGRPPWLYESIWHLSEPVPPIGQ